MTASSKDDQSGLYKCRVILLDCQHNDPSTNNTVNKMAMTCSFKHNLVAMATKSETQFAITLLVQKISPRSLRSS